MWITRKTDRIIIKHCPSLPLAVFVLIFGIGIIGSSVLTLVRNIKSVNTLEIACNRIEPKLVDCRLTTIPKLSLFRPSTETYAGIRGVAYLTATKTKKDKDGDPYTVTYYYVIFSQVSGQNKVQFDDRAEWVVNQINEYLNSSQEVLLQTKSNSIEPFTEIILPGIFLILGLIIFFNGFGFFDLESIEINTYLKQIKFSSSEITLSYEDIECVVLTEKSDEDDNKTYRLEFHTIKKDGFDIFRIPKYNRHFDILTTFNKKEAKELADEICRLTGFRLIEQRLPSSETN